MKGDIQFKVNGCSWPDGLPRVLLKGAPFELVCHGSVISSMASVASFNPGSGNIGLPRLLLKGAPFELVCHGSVISSMASVASFNPGSGNIRRPTAEGTVLISSPLNCATRLSLFTTCLGRGS